MNSAPPEANQIIDFCELQTKDQDLTHGIWNVAQIKEIHKGGDNKEEVTIDIHYVGWGPEHTESNIPWDSPRIAPAFQHSRVYKALLNLERYIDKDTGHPRHKKKKNVSLWPAKVYVRVPHDSTSTFSENVLLNEDKVYAQPFMLDKMVAKYKQMFNLEGGHWFRCDALLKDETLVDLKMPTKGLTAALEVFYNDSSEFVDHKCFEPGTSKFTATYWVRENVQRGSENNPTVKAVDGDESRVDNSPNVAESDPDDFAMNSAAFKACHELLERVIENDKHEVFLYPVDPVAHNIPDYFQIIKNPMDLTRVFNDLEERKFKNHEDFAKNVRLVFNNAMKYNVAPEHPIHAAAKDLLTFFEQWYSGIRWLFSERRLGSLSPQVKSPVTYSGVSVPIGRVIGDDASVSSFETELSTMKNSPPVSTHQTKKRGRGRLRKEVVEATMEDTACFEVQPKKRGRGRPGKVVEETVEDTVCFVCKSGDNAESLLLCDGGCDEGYHMGCLDPPLAKIPRGDWFCPMCDAKRQQCKTKALKRSPASKKMLQSQKRQSNSRIESKDTTKKSTLPLYKAQDENNCFSDSTEDSSKAAHGSKVKDNIESLKECKKNFESSSESEEEPSHNMRHGQPSQSWRDSKSDDVLYDDSSCSEESMKHTVKPLTKKKKLSIVRNKKKSEKDARKVYENTLARQAIVAEKEKLASMKEKILLENSKIQVNLNRVGRMGKYRQESNNDALGNALLQKAEHIRAGPDWVWKNQQRRIMIKDQGELTKKLESISHFEKELDARLTQMDEDAYLKQTAMKLERDKKNAKKIKRRSIHDLNEKQKRERIEAILAKRNKSVVSKSNDTTLKPVPKIPRKKPAATNPTGGSLVKFGHDPYLESLDPSKRESNGWQGNNKFSEPLLYRDYIDRNQGESGWERNENNVVDDFFMDVPLQKNFSKPESSENVPSGWNKCNNDNVEAPVSKNYFEPASTGMYSERRDVSGWQKIDDNNKDDFMEAPLKKMSSVRRGGSDDTDFSSGWIASDPTTKDPKPSMDSYEWPPSFEPTNNRKDSFNITAISEFSNAGSGRYKPKETSYRGGIASNNESRCEFMDHHSQEKEREIQPTSGWIKNDDCQSVDRFQSKTSSGWHTVNSLPPLNTADERNFGWSRVAEDQDQSHERDTYRNNGWNEEQNRTNDDGVSKWDSINFSFNNNFEYREKEDVQLQEPNDMDFMEAPLPKKKTTFNENSMDASQGPISNQHSERNTSEKSYSKRTTEVRNNNKENEFKPPVFENGTRKFFLAMDSIKSGRKSPEIYKSCSFEEVEEGEINESGAGNTVGQVSNNLRRPINEEGDSNFSSDDEDLFGIDGSEPEDISQETSCSTYDKQQKLDEEQTDREAENQQNEDNATKTPSNEGSADVLASKEVVHYGSNDSSIKESTVKADNDKIEDSKPIEISDKSTNYQVNRNSLQHSTFHVDENRPRKEEDQNGAGLAENLNAPMEEDINTGNGNVHDLSNDSFIKEKAVRANLDEKEAILLPRGDDGLSKFLQVEPKQEVTHIQAILSIDGETKEDSSSNDSQSTPDFVDTCTPGENLGSDDISKETDDHSEIKGQKNISTEKRCLSPYNANQSKPLKDFDDYEFKPSSPLIQVAQKPVREVQNISPHDDDDAIPTTPQTTKYPKRNDVGQRNILFVTKKTIDSQECVTTVTPSFRSFLPNFDSSLSDDEGYPSGLSCEDANTVEEEGIIFEDGDRPKNSISNNRSDTSGDRITPHPDLIAVASAENIAVTDASDDKKGIEGLVVSMR